MTRARRSLLGWLLNAPPPPPPSRLTVSEAVAIAGADPAVQRLGRPLPMITVHSVDGRVVWRISSATIGAQWWVEVDDETGTVGPLHEAGAF